MLRVARDAAVVGHEPEVVLCMVEVMSLDV